MQLERTDEPLDPRLPWEVWPDRPGWPADARAGDPPYYRVMLPSCDRPLGIHMGHTWHEAGCLLRLVELCGVKRFVEIGTHAGGLSSLLIARALFNAEFSYLGIEINRGAVRGEVQTVIDVLGMPDTAFIIYGDCLHETVKGAVARFAYSDVGRTMFYCDDGNKPAELQAYASMPRAGDILAVHDVWEGQKVRDLPGYGPLENGGRPFPGPEVLAQDLAFLPALGFERMDPETWTDETRIAAFVRL